MSQSSPTNLTFDIKGGATTNQAIYVAHERWYQKQPTTHCRRCDREFPNATNDRVEYCSRECEVGWFPPKPVVKAKAAKAGHRLKHLPVSRYQSNWS